MVFEETDLTDPFVPASRDALNTGVFRNNGSRKPPTFPMQVDDCMYANVDEYFKLTAASSIISLEDTFGVNPVYNEERLLLGHELNT
jgi:hypothetical protein